MVGRRSLCELVPPYDYYDYGRTTITEVCPTFSVLSDYFSSLIRISLNSAHIGLPA